MFSCTSGSPPRQIFSKVRLIGLKVRRLIAMEVLTDMSVKKEGCQGSNFYLTLLTQGIGRSLQAKALTLQTGKTAQ